jgi:hypothetical protein
MIYSGWEEGEDCPNLQDRQENGSKGMFIYLIDCLIYTLILKLHRLLRCCVNKK